jgi:TonB family protein
MALTDRRTETGALRTNLESACAQAIEGDYTAALAMLESAKSENPGNIYLVALERQVRSLVDLVLQPDSDSSAQQVVIDTFPNLVDNAVAEATRPLPAAEEPAGPPPPPRALAPGQTERAPELTRLVEDFFKQADAAIRRGDLENASREINRIFIIDPGNAKAKAYEHTVARLITSRMVTAPRPAPPAAKLPAAPAAKPPAPPAAKPPAPPRPVITAPSAPRKEPVRFVPVAPPPRPSAPPAPAAVADPKAPASAGESELMVLTVTEPPALHEPRAKKHDTAKPAFIPFLVVLLLGVAGVVGYTFVFSGDAEKEAIASIEPAPEQPVPYPVVVEPAADQQAAAAEQDYTPIPSKDVSLQRSEPAVEAGGTDRKREPESTVASPRQDRRSDDRRSEKPDGMGGKPGVPAPKIEFLRTPALAAAATPGRTTPPPGAPGSAPATPDPKSATEPVGQPAGQTAEQKTGEAPAEEPPAEPEPSTPFVDVMKEPVVLRLEKPRISEAARLAGAKGEVVAQVQIDTDGKPLAVRVVRSSNTLMNDAVIAALMRSEYQPGQMSSGPVRCWLTIPFRFK